MYIIIVTQGYLQFTKKNSMCVTTGVLRDNDEGITCLVNSQT